MNGGISSLRNLAGFGMLYTHSEIKARKEKFISFAQLREIFRSPQVDKGYDIYSHAYQWDIARHGLIIKSVFGGQALVVAPEKNIVVAFFNHIDKGWDMVMSSEKAIRAIVNAVEKSK